MKDKDLWKLVDHIRRTRHLVNEADELLCGIFGYPKGHPDREHRTQKAQMLMTKAAQHINNSPLIKL